jgi:lysophospholipase L1-like esterase
MVSLSLLACSSDGAPASPGAAGSDAAASAAMTTGQAAGSAGSAQPSAAGSGEQSSDASDRETRPTAGTGSTAGTSGQPGGPAEGGAAGMTSAPSGAAGAEPVAAAGAGGSAAAAAGASGGTAGEGGEGGAPPATCEKGSVKASEVVFIGESFIAATGDIPRMTSQLARDAGTIGPSDSYRSFAVVGTQLITGEIPMQYADAAKESPVKVVLMDGGGNDLLWGERCQSGFDEGCKEVVTTVEELFGQMAADGVKDVVYFFYPDPMGGGASIKEAMDTLRPEMKASCEAATSVRCVWVDQRESWEGRYDEFTSDGIHPTEAGSQASSQQIWDAMVANCIAQ